MSTTIPRVSIALPVYNGENFLKVALDSILAQTFEDFELIISDNASTDRTREICQEYAAKDQRIKYYRNEENIGAAQNYNKLLEYARSNYFMWVNHDDRYAPSLLEKCVAVLDNDESTVLAYSKAILIDDKGEKIENILSQLGMALPHPYQRFQLYHSYQYMGNSEGRTEGLWTPVYGLVRADVLRRTGLIGAYISSDTILLEEILLQGKFHEIPEYLLFKRNHKNRSMQLCYDFRERMAWFNPQKKSSRLVFLHWMLFFKRVGIIHNTQMSLNDKVRCYAQMLTYLRNRRKNLVRELFINLAFAFNVQSIKLWNIDMKVPKTW